MIRQYYTSPFKAGSAKQVGTVDVGAVIYIQDRYDRYLSPVCVNPWIVEAWIPRELFGLRMRGGHLAQVRSLRNGSVKLVADHHLLAAIDAGLDFSKPIRLPKRMRRAKSVIQLDSGFVYHAA